VALLLARAWDPAVIGEGVEELIRLVRAHLAAAVLVGLVAFGLDLPSARPWVFVGAPVACGLSLAGRVLLRAHLRRLRAAGRAMTRVLAVGSEESLPELIERTRRAPHLGWVVAGACTPTGAGPYGGATIRGVPVVGDLDGVAALALTAGYGAVAVGPAAGWTPYRLRQLARDLDGSRTRLLVDPALVDVGPRLHAVTLDGLPLLRLTRPVLGPAPRLVKGMVDRGVALALLLMLSPLLLGIATAVRRDGGRALCRETRVGRDGRTFRLLRFRTVRLGDRQ
jgi:hypothetical protein